MRKTAHPWRKPFIPTLEPIQTLGDHLTTLEQRFKNKALRDWELEEGDNLSYNVIHGVNR